MRWKWQKLFSYVEVICFVSAWAIGLLMARDHGRVADEQTVARTFAAASELPGAQASLGR